MSRARFLPLLPKPDAVDRRLRLLAMYDAIAAPAERSFTWSPGLSVFQDAEGSFLRAWFGARSTVLFGWNARSPMSAFRWDPPKVWPGILAGAPSSFDFEATTPDPLKLTFAYWFLHGKWKTARNRIPRIEKAHDVDGASHCLSPLGPWLDRWRLAYYGTKVYKKYTDVIWEERPLTRDVVLAINANADFRVVRAEAKKQGWPVSGLEGAGPFVPRAAERKPKPKAFGHAEFTVRGEEKRVVLLAGDGTIVAECAVDVFDECFHLTNARLEEAEREGY